MLFHGRWRVVRLQFFRDKMRGIMARLRLGWKKIALCPYCRQPVDGALRIHRGHLAADDFDPRGNAAMCGWIHRGILPQRVPLIYRTGRYDSIGGYAWLDEEDDGAAEDSPE